MSDEEFERIVREFNNQKCVGFYIPDFKTQSEYFEELKNKGE